MVVKFFAYLVSREIKHQISIIIYALYIWDQYNQLPGMGLDLKGELVSTTFDVGTPRLGLDKLIDQGVYRHLFLFKELYASFIFILVIVLTKLLIGILQTLPLLRSK